jgi:hypothetical protein
MSDNYWTTPATETEICTIPAEELRKLLMRDASAIVERTVRKNPGKAQCAVTISASPAVLKQSQLPQQITINVVPAEADRAIA